MLILSELTLNQFSQQLQAPQVLEFNPNFSTVIVKNLLFVIFLTSYQQI